MPFSSTAPSPSSDTRSGFRLFRRSATLVPRPARQKTGPDAKSLGAETEVEARRLELAGLDGGRGGDRARLHQRQNALARKQAGRPASGLVFASSTEAVQTIVRVRKATSLGGA